MGSPTNDVDRWVKTGLRAVEYRNVFPQLLFFNVFKYDEINVTCRFQAFDTARSGQIKATKFEEDDRQEKNWQEKPEIYSADKDQYAYGSEENLKEKSFVVAYDLIPTPNSRKTILPIRRRKRWPEAFHRYFQCLWKICWEFDLFEEVKCILYSNKNF